MPKFSQLLRWGIVCACGFLVGMGGALGPAGSSWGLPQACAAGQYWEYEGLKTATAPKSPPAFAEMEMRAPDTTGNLPQQLARATAFAYLYEDTNGLGPDGHYYGNWDRAGLGLEIHLKGNIRGVFLMYNRTPW